MRDRRMMDMNSAPTMTMGDHGHRDVRPEKLRLLGKQASILHERDGVDLSSAVVSVLSDEEGMGPEHIRRVAEFANTYAFDSEFKKQSGDHRVIDFDGGPADPSAVMKDLNQGATPAEYEAPRSATVSDRDAFVPGEDGLAAAFGVGTEKRASAVYASERPMGSIEDTYFQLRDLENTLLSHLVSKEVEYQSATEDMYKEARQVILGGSSPSDVVSVVSVSAPTKDLEKLALKLIMQRVERDGDLPSGPMEKSAEARVVNQNHPLYQACREFMKVATERFTCLAAAEQARAQLSVVRRRLKG